MGEISKNYVTERSYQEDQWRLAAQVRRGGWRPDWIVGLWRGGASVAVSIHEFLKATGWPAKHIPLKCGCYSAIGCNEGAVQFTLLNEVLAAFNEGEKVLVVDDVFDTGKTAKALFERLEAKGVDSRFACVYFKPKNNSTSMRPYYFVNEMGEEWLVFPHEIEGLSLEEVRQKSSVLAELIDGLNS